MFLNSTWYVPAAGTEGIAGVKPRSKASMAIVPALTVGGWLVATAGCAALAVAGA